jgi:transmembrane sensor
MSHEKPAVHVPKLKLSWDERRTERLLERVHARLDRQRRVMRSAIAAGALLSMVGVGVALLRSRNIHPSAPIQTTSAIQTTASHSIKLKEGSEITLDPTTSEIRVVEENPSHVRVDIVKGSGRYSVVPDAQRTFEVHSGAVTVTVLGTEFVVDQRTEGTWVEVFRGKVRVSWGTEQAFLAAGESGTFPRPNGPPEVAAPHAPTSAQATQAYRSRVAHHDYRGAYAVLARNPTLAGDTVEELLVAADVARLSDHPAEALPYLQRIVRDYPRDERAPMAAFTLGRTLSGLGRTQEAMQMFARVRSTWPQNALAEDALLRQAEAASQLSDLTTARRLAEQYDRDYPNGRRRSEVRRYARLE